MFCVGGERKVSEFLSSPIYPVMVISYEMLVRCIDDVRKVNFDLIVCDEGHRLKNAGIKTTSVSGDFLHKWTNAVIHNLSI